MDNSSAHKVKRWLVNGTLLLLLLPLFSPLIYYAAFGRAGSLRASVVFGVTLLAAVLVLWRGSATLAMVILLLSIAVGSFWTDGASPDEGYRRMDLVIGERSPIMGVNVYCNGVHLGTTPLRISREEFPKKVEPWETPPRQPVLKPFGDPKGDNAFHSALYTWAPHDPFEPYEERPPRHKLTRAHSDSEIFKLLPEVEYWWRFQKNGHDGLARATNFGGSSGGSMAYLEINANPDITYPALSPHVELLVDTLRRNGYSPTERWIEHFLKYRELLFLDFHKRTQGESRLRTALEAVVRAHFDLPENPTQEDCSRVVERIVRTAQEHGSFQVPSMSSMALDIMGEAAAPAVTRLFRARINTRPHGWGRSSSGNWEMRFYEPGGGLLPLEYAAKRLRPEELFAPLVYQYGRQDRYFDIVASYRNANARRLVEHYLRDLQRGSHRKFQIRRALEKLTDVRNPEVEERIRQAFRELGYQNEHVVRQFIESRIGAPRVDQTELATWVFHSAPIDEDEKLRLITRIPSPRAYHYLRILGVPRDRSEREDAIYEVATHPNPYLDEFVIDTWKWYDSPEGPGYWSRTMTKALLGNDTERVQDFVRETVQKGGEDARKMLHRLARSEVDMSRKQWLQGLVREFDSPALQATAAGILAKMDSEAARKLLRQWAESDDEKVRTAAEDSLEAHRQRQQKEKERMRQYEALLAGDIDPDELAPPMKAWVWNGERYVPEQKAEESGE